MRTDHLRTWAEVDLEALQHNFRVAQDYARGQKIMAVVKADAYGHGLTRITKALAGHAEWFGVANVEEGLEVHAQAPGKVFVLGPLLPHERTVAIEQEFVVSLSNGEEAEALNYEAMAVGKSLSVHLAVDTGMGRMGCLESELAGLVACVESLPHLKLNGIATHFPVADEDAAWTTDQISAATQLMEETLPTVAHRHFGNSAGILDFSGQLPQATMARPGLMLYGISPTPEHASELRAVMSLKSRVTLVRDLPKGRGISYGRTFVTDHPMRVATIGIGYGDGYQRHLSGQGAEVLIHGERCPLLGRVTMDQIVVDVTYLETVPAPGAEVVLMGRQGDDQITATELAEKSGTIPWEILTGVTKRVRRVYTGKAVGSGQ